MEKPPVEPQPFVGPDIVLKPGQTLWLELIADGCRVRTPSTPAMAKHFAQQLNDILWRNVHINPALAMPYVFHDGQRTNAGAYVDLRKLSFFQFVVEDTTNQTRDPTLQLHERNVNVMERWIAMLERQEKSGEHWKDGPPPGGME